MISLPKNIGSIAKLIFTGLVIFLARFLIFGLKPYYFSYDYGFYLKAATINLGSFGWNYLTAAFFGGYGNILFPFAGLLHLPAAATLEWTLILSCVAIGWLLIRYSAEQKGMWLFAVLLYSVSLVQLEAYSMFLWKNIVASVFLLAALVFFKEKKYWLFGISAVLIFLTHRTTAIVFVVVMAAYFGYFLIKTGRIRLLLIILAAALVSAAVFLLSARGWLTEVVNMSRIYGIREGVFFEFISIPRIVWPYALLACPGVVLYIKHKRHPLLPVFFFVCLVWILLTLPFYRRLLYFADLGLILFAAYFLSFFAKRYYGKAVILLLLVFLGFRSYNWMQDKKPLITEPEISEITQFKKPGFILATDSADAPWLLGFAPSAQVGAPGFGSSFLGAPVYFFDPHTQKDWADFRQQVRQTEFLSKYPRPLYLYQRSYKIKGLDNCLSRISPNFSEYTCE